MTSNSKLLVWVMAAAVSASAQTNVWELGDPGAKLLLGIDLKKLRESAMGQAIREQMNSQTATAGAQQPFQASMQAMALGLLEQIDRLYLSSPAKPSANTKKNPPFLMVVEGRLPIAQMKPFIQGTSRRYRTTDVYRTSKTDTTSVAVLEDGTLVLGDESSVLAAIDRRAGLRPPPSALLTRAQALASTHDFWIISDEPLSNFQPANTGTGNPQIPPIAAQIASQIKGLDLGLSLRDGFQFELSLATESDAAAAKMAQLFSDQIQTAMAAQANQPGMAEMVGKLKIGAQGNRLNVNMNLTKGEFEQQLQAARAARATAAAAAIPPPAAQPAPRPTPGKITIYGLDGGPREIQTTR
jgi:hypothetical protein